MLKNKQWLRLLLLLIAASQIHAETHLKASSTEKAADSGQLQILTIEKLHVGLIDAMRAELGYSERADKLTPLIETSFDVETISRIALGPRWRDLSPQEQSQIHDLMKELIISSYTSRFTRYKNEVFSTQSDKSISKTRHIVRSTLTTVAGKIVTLDYHLTERSGNWKIFDVVAEGVSDLALKRSSYGASFRNSGLAGVIADIKLNTKNNKSQ